MWAIMGENRPPLSFCVGESENSQVFWIDLAKCPHVMIAGASGQGKSNMINSILCTLIRNNTPEQVKFVLFDMKEGIEFTFYDDLPHLYKSTASPDLSAIVDDPTKALDAMYALKDEMKRRMNFIKTAGHKNIGSYNLHRYTRNRLPYLVIAFDEIATPLLYFGARFERLLNELTNQARAAGMHFLLGTQYPKAEILTTLVTINFPVRFAFSMPMGASMSVLGNHNAVGLPCPGRSILQREGEDIQTQTPLISDAIVRATVKTAITGKKSKGSLVAIEDVLSWAIESANGDLKYDDIFPIFRKRGLRFTELKEMLMASDGKEYEVNSEMYRVERSYGRLPRHMVRIAPDGADILANSPNPKSEKRKPSLNSQEKEEQWFHGPAIAVDAENRRAVKSE
jgi:ABC-type dipeptide/oligopeptide/nickel transport system ATPase component